MQLYAVSMPSSLEDPEVMAAEQNRVLRAK